MSLLSSLWSSWWWPSPSPSPHLQPHPWPECSLFNHDRYWLLWVKPVFSELSLSQRVKSWWGYSQEGQGFSKDAVPVGRRRHSQQISNKKLSCEAQKNSKPHKHGYHTRTQPHSKEELRMDAWTRKRPVVERSQFRLRLQRRKSRKGPGQLANSKQQKVREAKNDFSQHLCDKLKEDNPLDELSYDIKKRLAAHMVLSCIHGKSEISRRWDVWLTVAGFLEVNSWSVRKLAQEYDVYLELKTSERGMHSKAFSPITNPEFEEFWEKLTALVRQRSLGSKGTSRLTVKNVTQCVNDDRSIHEELTYSERTTCRWLRHRGFELMTVWKTVDIDGHEQPQVVADHIRLAKELQEIRHSLIDDESLEVEENPMATHVLITRDEKIHRSNDAQKRFWGDCTMEKLPAKSQGRTSMTSDVLSEIYSFVRYN